MNDSQTQEIEIPVQPVHATRPEWTARFTQNWELISFITTSEHTQTYEAVSTAAIGDERFETFIPEVGIPVSDELRIRGMETFNFIHGKPSSDQIYDMSFDMEYGCEDHFRWVSKTAFKSAPYQSSGDGTLTDLLDHELPKHFRLVTFIYKPVKNGWIVVETTKQENGEVKTVVYSKANKANREEAVNNAETLYFDRKDGREFENSSPGLQGHFRVVSDEIEANYGHYDELAPCPLDRTALKKRIGVIV